MYFYECAYLEVIYIKANKSKTLAILSLALVFMIVFTLAAIQVLLWQSNDISVSIVSETTEGNKEVTISVLNTAGATLLFYENTEMTGKIEYLSENGWVEYCDVSYTASNSNAFSSQYGGTFAELEPGEGWDVKVPEEKIDGMKNGTYRIKMTYVTEKEYNQYLDNEFNNRNNIPNEIPKDDGKDVIIPDKSQNVALKPVAGENKNDLTIQPQKEAFLAESVCEVFVKTFEYTAPEDFVGEISIADKDIETARSISPKKLPEKKN